MSGISVVIPLYNKLASIDRAIRSVLGQQADVELIVIDDGSTDGSSEIARGYDDRIVYERQENAGPGAARNRGVERATAPVIAFLDADDRLEPGCLAAHLDCRAERPDAEITLSPFRMEGDDGSSTVEALVDRRVDWVRRGRFHYAEGFHYDLARGFVGSAVCIDRNLFHAIGGFDLRLHCWEIFDLLYRAALTAPVTGVIDEVGVVAHRDLGESQFERTRARMDFRVVQAHNVMDRMDEVPAAERASVFQVVDGCLRDLLALGAVEQAQDLARRVGPTWCPAAATRTLRAMRVLPAPVLKTASLVSSTRSLLARSYRRWSQES